MEIFTKNKSKFASESIINALMVDQNRQENSNVNKTRDIVHMKSN